jgi:hypothetical protein
VQVHLYGYLITHRWIAFIIISHLGQHWIIQRSSLNFWREFAALKVINVVPLHDCVPLVVDSSQKNTVLYLYVGSLKCGKRSQSSRGPNTFAGHCKFYSSSKGIHAYGVFGWCREVFRVTLELLWYLPHLLLRVINFFVCKRYCL